MKNLTKIAVAQGVPLAEHEASRKELEREVQKTILETDDEQLKTDRIMATVVR